jgi:hypothetical protein
MRPGSMRRMSVDGHSIQCQGVIHLVLSAALIVTFSLVGGCRAREKILKVSIEFTRIPPAAEGGPDKLDIIQGRVVGGHAGQRIVLYAKSGVWWVQPVARLPFTDIQPDSTWVNSTHLGTEYAALLVEPGYPPPAKLRELPRQEAGVAAVARVKGSDAGAGVSKIITFSGYEWRVRNAPSDRGWRGVMNAYSPANAWTDRNGWLHLRISKESGKWQSAEVSLTRSFGYGTYRFRVQDISRMEPGAVLGMFTWDYAGGDRNHREMSIEISQWGDPINKNAQFVVQPLFVPENVARFEAPPEILTHSFRWEPGEVSFRTVRGSEGGNKATVVSEHVFTSGVPTPGVETIRMNLYVYHGGRPLQNGTEVVVEKFEYLP